MDPTPPPKISRTALAIRKLGASAKDLMPLFIVFIIGAIVIAIAKDLPVIGKLSDAAYARGVITFIITVATIGLAFVLVYAAFNTAPDGKEDERFRRGREVFTVLMGVLGTIVGFYFGSTEKTSALPEIAPIKLSDQELTTHIAGGLSPYRYTIVSTDTNFQKVSRSSDDGWIIESLNGRPKPGSTLEVEVTDGRNQKTTRKTSIAGELTPDTSKPSAQTAPANTPPTSEKTK
jgi:hypothetical protein